jgi:site-specific DNA recombinase
LENFSYQWPKIREACHRVSAPRIERVIIDALNGAKIAPSGTSEAKLLWPIDKIILHPVEIELRLNDESSNGGLLRVAADLRPAKNGIRIIEGHGANQRSESLVRAIALAHDWRQQMERGSFQTIKALADAKGLSDSYVWKILRLGYLAPDIVEAILDGRQPVHLSLHLINAAKLSGD